MTSLPNQSYTINSPSKIIYKNIETLSDSSIKTTITYADGTVLNSVLHNNGDITLTSNKTFSVNDNGTIDLV